MRLSGQANGVRFPPPTPTPSLGVEQRAILQNPVEPHFHFQECLLLTLAKRHVGEVVSFQCVRLLPAPVTCQEHGAAPVSWGEGGG